MNIIRDRSFPKSRNFTQAQRPQQSQSPSQPQSHSNSHPSSQLLPTLSLRQQRPREFSEWSTAPISDSGFACEDFMLGVGMVIIQPSTNKVVVVYDKDSKRWFLPRGRKDVGESLEQAVVREAYEESGYNAQLMPIWSPHHQPAPPSNPCGRYQLCTEPIYMSIMGWGPRFTRDGKVRDSGGEYFIWWYIGEIPEDAVYTANTGMPDEQGYTSHLMTFQQAMDKLRESEGMAMRYAKAIYERTIAYHEYMEELRRQEEERALRDHNRSVVTAENEDEDGSEWVDSETNNVPSSGSLSPLEGTTTTRVPTSRRSSSTSRKVSSSRELVLTE